MRRKGVIVAASLAAVAGAAIAVVAVRDAVYWEKPLPGVEVREIALDRPISVRVGGERYAVDPSAFLRLDEAATELAARERGHDSFRTRVRALADPSPPTLLVDPVLVQAGPLDGNLDTARAEAARPEARAGLDARRRALAARRPDRRAGVRRRAGGRRPARRPRARGAAHATSSRS